MRQGKSIATETAAAQEMAGVSQTAAQQTAGIQTDAESQTVAAAQRNAAPQTAGTDQAAGAPQIIVVEKKRGNKLFRIIILLLLLIIAGVLLWHQFGPKPSLERELTAKLGIMPGMTEAEIQDILNRQVAEGMLNVSMNPMPVFPDGKSEGNVQIQNIQGNHYSVKVTIVRSDNNKTILTTNLIDPGYYVQTLKLDKPLPKGKYLCVANFDAYDPKTLDYVGGTGMQVLITVQK